MNIDEMKAGREARHKEIQTAVHWFGLSIRELRPFLTVDEWHRLCSLNNELVLRLAKSVGGEATLSPKQKDDPSEWPDSIDEMWNSYK